VEQLQQIKIRKIEISDYADIQILSTELGHTCEAEEVKERIAYITENTKDIILVAQKSNEVIGFIHGSPYELLYTNPLVNIMAFAVKQAYRNIGIGSMLLKRFEELVKEEGFSGVRMVSRLDRVDAHRFYEKHGYVNRKNQKNFIKIFD